MLISIGKRIKPLGSSTCNLDLEGGFQWANMGFSGWGRKAGSQKVRNMEGSGVPGTKEPVVKAVLIKVDSDRTGRSVGIKTEI